MPLSAVIPSNLERSVQQRSEALAYANRVRLYRADVKRRLKAREVKVVDVLVANDPLLASMRVVDLLMAAPGVGFTKSRALLGRLDVSVVKTVGGLSPRQRSVLVDALSGDSLPYSGRLAA